MTERLNGRNGHNEGVLIVNPKDQVDVTKALREQVRRATDWEYAPVCDELNVWADRIQQRFYDCILYPDRPPLQPAIIGIRPMRHDSYLASYCLTHNQLGLRYEIDLNERHFRDVTGLDGVTKKTWVFGGLWGVLESLTHELGHHWQQEGGGKEPFRQGARETHNKEFRDKMESIGIHSNADGVHTAPADGAFAQLMKEYGVERPQMPEGPDINIEDWMKFFAEFFADYKPKGRSTLHKWSCERCGFSVNATTRKDISLICGDCKAETGDDIFFVRSERRRPNSHQLKPTE